LDRRRETALDSYEKPLSALRSGQDTPRTQLRTNNTLIRVFRKWLFATIAPQTICANALCEDELGE